MNYRFSPGSAADVINGFEGSKQYTVILGRNCGKEWANLLPLVEDYFKSNNDMPLSFLDTGLLGTVANNVSILYCGGSLPRIVSDNEFAIIEGAMLQSIHEAIGTNGLITLPSLEIKHKPNLVTVDEMETLAAHATKIFAYVEIIQGRFILLEVNASEIRGIFYGRNGVADVRAYLNEHHSLIIGEPVPEQEEE
jgi:hypothetical protein